MSRTQRTRFKRTLADLALVGLAGVLGAIGLRLVTLILDLTSAALGNSTTGRAVQESLLLTLSTACLLSWAVAALTIVLKRVRDAKSNAVDTIRMLVPVLNAIHLLNLALNRRRRATHRRRSSSIRVAWFRTSASPVTRVARRRDW